MAGDWRREAGAGQSLHHTSKPAVDHSPCDVATLRHQTPRPVDPASAALASLEMGEAMLSHQSTFVGVPFLLFKMLIFLYFRSLSWASGGEDGWDQAIAIHG
jgi:hypothetical protein